MRHDGDAGAGLVPGIWVRVKGTTAPVMELAEVYRGFGITVRPDPERQGGWISAPHPLSSLEKAPLNG